MFCEGGPGGRLFFINTIFVKKLPMSRFNFPAEYLFCCRRICAKANRYCSAYQRAHIPPFRVMLLPDSAVFTHEQLEKGKQTIIMIFSPDCEHCVNSIKDLLAHVDLFKKVQFVMATPLSFALTKKFYNEHGFDAYPNIHMGTMNDFALGQYFNMHMFPAFFFLIRKESSRRSLSRRSVGEDSGKVMMVNTKMTVTDEKR